MKLEDCFDACNIVYFEFTKTATLFIRIMKRCVLKKDMQEIWSRFIPFQDSDLNKICLTLTPAFLLQMEKD